MAYVYRGDRPLVVGKEPEKPAPPHAPIQAPRPKETRTVQPYVCGTLRAYRHHLRQGDPTCQECRDAAAATKRASYKPRQKQTPLKPCGTKAAYARHLYHNEEPCAPCKKANRDEAREWEAAKKEKP